MRFFFIINLLLVICIFSSCEKRYYIDKNNIAYPILLSTDSLNIDIRKYLGDDTKLKSIKSHKNIICSINSDSVLISINIKGEIPDLSNLRITTTKGNYDIPAINNTRSDNLKSKPRIVGLELYPDMISYTIDKMIDTTLIYINNKRISNSKLELKNSVFTLILPKFTSIPRSAILRIYASSSKNGISNEFCVPISNGQFVKDFISIDTTTNITNKDISIIKDDNYLNIYKEAVNTFIESKHTYAFIDSVVSSSLVERGAYMLINRDIENKNYKPNYIKLAYLDRSLAEILTTYKNPEKSRKTQSRINQLNTFLMTIPGSPSYYVKPSLSDINHTGQEFSFKKVENLRKNNIPLLYGSYHSLRNDNLTYAYVRKYFDEFTIVIFNRSKYMKKRKINLHTSFVEAEARALFESRFDIVKGKLIIELQPYSVEIITGRITI